MARDIFRDGESDIQLVVDTQTTALDLETILGKRFLSTGNRDYIINMQTQGLIGNDLRVLRGLQEDKRFQTKVEKAAEDIPVTVETLLTSPDKEAQIRASLMLVWQRFATSDIADKQARTEELQEIAAAAEVKYSDILDVAMPQVRDIATNLYISSN